MKKLIAIITIVALVATLISLAACAGNPKEHNPEKEDANEAENNTSTNVPAVGGWTIDTDAKGTLPDDVKEAFDAAIEGLTGVKLEPVTLLGTQIVAGSNYLILCKATPITPNGEVKWVLAKLYAGVDGTREIKIADFNYTAYRDAETAAAAQEALCGGWTVTEAINEVSFNDKADAAFKGVTEGLLGVGYEPIALLGTQVVAGTNYAFLTKATPVTPNAVSYLEILFVYENLEGGYELLNAGAINLAAIEF